ncbi:MAG: hypothetical protein PWR11_649 [Bacillota bacterium]|nr:hypothetical protein [Bacillota bacterium]
MYRKKDASGGAKRLRRLEILLPEDHPIWACPKGRRGERIRELLDLALRLERGFDLLERRLARLEQAVKSEGCGRGAEQRSDAVQPDAAAWLRAWD